MKSRNLAGKFFWLSLVCTTHLISLQATAAKLMGQDAKGEAPANENKLATSTTISVDEARQMVEESTEKIGLSLDSVTEIDKDVAMVLSKTKGLLSLASLQSIDLDSARALTNSNNFGIQLNGLGQITPEVAKALSRATYLELNALKPSPQVVIELADRAGTLSLNGLESLDVETAIQLTKKPYPLTLNGIRSVSLDVAKVLVASKGPIALDEIEELSIEAQEVFAKRNGDLSFRSIKSIRHPQFAEFLSRQPAGVRLPKLEEISPDSLSMLAKTKQTLSLGIHTLTTEQAKAISQCSSKIELPQVQRLDQDQIEILLQSSARLEFSGLLEVLDVRFAERLAKNARGSLRLGKVETLSAAVAKAITTGKASLYLPKLEALEPDVARAFATSKVLIILTGLKQMSDQDAELLAKIEGTLTLSRKMLLSDHARKLLESNDHIKWKDN